MGLDRNRQLSLSQGMGYNQLLEVLKSVLKNVSTFPQRWGCGGYNWQVHYQIGL